MTMYVLLVWGVAAELSMQPVAVFDSATEARCWAEREGYDPRSMRVQAVEAPER